MRNFARNCPHADLSFLYFRRFLQPLFLTIVLVWPLTEALAIRREHLIDTWRPLHYSVTIKLNDNLSEIIQARAEIRIVALKNLAVIDLDFGELTIDSISVNERSAKFERRAALLRIKLPEAQPRESHFNVAIAYHGKPKDGLILTLDKDGKPSAIGDNWPDRVHEWIPCLDHPSAKATVNFTVTAPAHDLVVANGRLDRVETTSTGTRTWSYSESSPIPPYCMVIAVGQFAKVEGGKSVTPLTYYVPQRDKKYATKGFAPAAPALRFFSQTVAPYPYEKLALIVGATRFGGMENSSAIVFSNNLFEPFPNARLSRAFGIRQSLVEIVAHEIAHQWFGDSVTESTWADLWLSEGFATYFAALFIERYEGEQAFQDYMRQAAETYFRYEQRSRTPIFDRETEDLLRLLNANNYQKGAWVLHMLRKSLGDDAFFRGIKTYYESHKGGTANSEDLRAALEKTSGQNLREFFTRWIYGTGHPQYELSWTWKSAESQVVIVLRQNQSEPAFTNQLPIDIVTADSKQRLILRPRSRESVERFRLPGAPLSINVDPDNSVLKEISLKPPR